MKLSSNIKPQRRAKATKVVDVVVPAFRGLTQTLRCLGSVLESRNLTNYRLIVIDDASPEPALSAELKALAANGRIELLTNVENLGFVRTVNRGMRLSTNDVVLLNADTVVFGDWLDRLVAQAQFADDIATVTPLSNNATILSYPRTLETNAEITEDAARTIDAICASALAGTSQDVPTGVGFCFYIKRAVLDAVGFFDEDTFLKGYGEENDFCLRASNAGWRNIAACDVFVMHEGAVSFSASAGDALAEGLRRLNARYPKYGPLIQAFIKEDPLAEVRRTIDLARAAKDQTPGILMIDHGWGGGIDSHITDLTTRLEREGYTVFRIAPNAKQTALCLTASDYRHLPNLGTLPVSDPDALMQLFQGLGICHAHIHSTVFYGFTWVENLIQAIGRAYLEYDFTLHDYATLCPLVQMIDASGAFCDSRSETQCQACLTTQKSPFGPVEIKAWRTFNHALLKGARRIFAPSEDTSQRLQSYWPEFDNIVVRPHPVIQRGGAERPSASKTEVRRIGLIGGIGPHKGSSILLACAIDALQRELPLQFIVFGNTDKPALLTLSNVVVRGRYQEADIGQLIAENPCDLSWFPSVWPETFCYTLDIAMEHGLYPVSFDLGAIPDRLRAMGVGEILPLQMMNSPDKINDRLLEIDTEIDWLSIPPESGRDWISAKAYYGPLPKLGPSPKAKQPLRHARTSHFARLAKNIIVTRSSPDWLTFDAQASRGFCLKHKLPETTVIDFIDLWDSTMSLPYRHVRSRLKEQSLACFKAVRDAEVLDLESFQTRFRGGLNDEDLIVFVDDDDWLSPQLFSTLRRNPHLGDGVLWGSLFLGFLASDTPVEKAHSPVLQKRGFSDTIYTNNYAISGRAMRRFELGDVLEHADAQRLFHSGRWNPVRSGEYLSLANKHPCCTVAAHYNMLSPKFVDAPVTAIHQFVAQLAAVRLDDQTGWIDELLRRFRALMAAAIREQPELSDAA